MTASIQTVIPAEQPFKKLSFLKIRPIQQPAANDAISFNADESRLIYLISTIIKADHNFANI